MVIEHGLAGRLAPEVLQGLGAVSRVSRALVGTGDLPALAGAALEEMRDALGLRSAALYLPDADGQPVLRRYVVRPDTEDAAPELAFDEEAWRLAVTGGAPIVLREAASWLVANPFDPPAEDWLILPLAGEEAGVVIAGAREPIAIDPLHGTVLTLLGLQLSAGVATARLRRRLREAEMERERRTLAAEVHDGLAQHLALARRELAMLEPDPRHERLREAIDEAHALVRARLLDLTGSAPCGLRAAVEEAARRRDVPVQVSVREDVQLGPELTTLAGRVVSEALANVDAHAHAAHAQVRVIAGAERLEISVSDDGRGFDPAAAPGVREGHLGLTVLRERARSYGGDCVVESRPGRGTRVRVRVPV